MSNLFVKMSIKLKNNYLGIILILCATLLLSFRSILVKLAYTEQILPMDLLYYRFLVTVPLLIIFAIWTKRKKAFLSICNKKILINCAIAGLFGYYLATLADFYSLKLIKANINRIIVYTFPIYVLLINSIINKKLPKKSDIFFFILVQTGLFFTAGGFIPSLQRSNIIGISLALMAAISYSIYIIINGQIGQKIGSILFTTYAVIFSFIFINIHFLFVDSNINNISNKGLTIIIIMFIFCTFLPLLLISKGIKLVGSSRFSLLNSSGPAITLLLSFLILKETMLYQQIVGSIFVLIMIYFFEKKQNKNNDQH